jgi:hypothetical protein
MPLMRYFLFVGGALLALMLVVNAFLPTPPAVKNPQQAADLSVIRIHSNQKWPERVVFDTARPTITPAPAPAAVVAQAPLPPKTVVAEPAKTQVREAYAQMRPRTNEPRNVEPKRKRKSVAKNNYELPRMVVAQQRPTFFVGNNIW